MTLLAGMNSWLWILCLQCSIGAHMLNLRARIPLLGYLTAPVSSALLYVLLCFTSILKPLHIQTFC